MDQEDQYWSHLMSTQRPFYPGFIRQMSSQVEGGEDEGQVVVINFQDEAKPQYQIYSRPQDLRGQFDNPPLPPSTDAVRSRRLFVLEGLSKSFIQLLGSRLRVPPSFFAAHCPHTGRMHSATIDEKTDEADPVYFNQSSITRQLHRINLFGDVKDPLWSFERVSFWSTREGGSWDAVLLVDPPLRDFVIRMGDPVPRRVLHLNSKNFNPPGIAEDSLSQDGSWFAPFLMNCAGEVPEMKSIFDDIISLYQGRQYQSTADPRACTDISEVVRKQYQMSVGSTTSTINYHVWLDKSWTQPWTEREFGGLMRAKSALESIKTSLSYNMDALGIGGQSSVGEEWEDKAWNSLQSAVTALKMKVDLMSEAYTQAISVRESIIANQQARQVGYLTSLATLFVPISFIAAVFSMGGDYAADQKRFYVFWAVSLPVAVVALSISFFGGYIQKLLPNRLITRATEESAV
ncbi:hypothetical protein F5B22DRAFT_662181 [Xylaria bambusicola]|uniref:uncharacterized protein n=1 Tax=Xylaria bambusicola TaxID=326684 RepID=UPI002008EAB8|nr:uncharacterized protein F5B22DRAFT_662181 [Xylaria bambusicola]KAI0503236.1 hypothetical protein F5B22DRAFT_662181 [Xylaria bambusicola]